MATTHALIPVFTGHLNNAESSLCDARTLHGFLRAGRNFSGWIKGRIAKYGFVEGVDFTSVSRLPILANKVVAGSGVNLGGRPNVEYHLTLDMAKELSMVENNAQGRTARRYFIDCEKQLNAGIPATLYQQALGAETREAKSFALASAGSRAMLLRKSEKVELLETITLMREAVQLRLALGYGAVTA